MDELHFLSVDDLKRILVWVISLNGDVLEVDGKLLYRAQGPHGRGGVSLEINHRTIEKLVEELRVVTVLSVSSDPTRVAGLLASVARIVGQTGPKVTRPTAALFAKTLGTDFGVASAAYLARARGYVIQLSKLPWDEIDLAVRYQDQRLLTQIFEGALGIAQFSSSIDQGGIDQVERRVPPERDHGETEALMRYYESQFAAEDSQRSILVSAAGRELSAESYWNLRSIAEMEEWDSETVLSLIDEHLYPNVHPSFVYYNVTVSGSDWLRLYRWLHGSGGVMLWKLSTSSHPRLSPSRSVAFRSRR